MIGHSETTRKIGKRLWPVARQRLGLVALVFVLLSAALWLQGCAAGGASAEADRATAAPSATPPSPTAVPVQPSPTAAPTAVPTQAQPTPAAPGALASADEVQRIGPVEAKALVDKGSAVLYDVRSADAYRAKHAAGALSLPLDQLESLAGSLPKGKTLILYCT